MRPRRTAAGPWRLGALLWLAAPGAAAAQQSHVVVISGLSGTPEHAERFATWAETFLDAAETRWGVARANQAWLAEDLARNPGRVSGRSTREEIERVVSALAARARPDDVVLILLLGHGSSQGGEARLSLPGPDLAAADFDRLLDRLPSQRVALVNAASASGDFVAPLSAPNRTIITATRSAGEKNETIFAEYFVGAYAGDRADTDKDGQVSLLEAFIFARREVERFYQSENRLQTEHALLDDNGDGEGSRDPDPAAGDGANARRFLLAGARAAQHASGQCADARLAPLCEQRRRLEEEVAGHRTRRGSMDSTAYQTELERLLLELATVSQRIRAQEPTP
jgi:hypothetical protein